MKAREIKPGTVFERWTITNGPTRLGRDIAYICVCSCGTIRPVLSCNLLGGLTRSCGCLQREITSVANFKHGKVSSHEYHSWANLKSRCLDSNNQDYNYYGGRGISVCERWLDFRNFYFDMGPCPKGLTLDRIQVDGNYEPGNCRWTTWSEQQRNKRPITICKRGHEFTEENTLIVHKKDRTQRLCRTCHRYRDRKQKERQAAA